MVSPQGELRGATDSSRSLSPSSPRTRLAALLDYVLHIESLQRKPSYVVPAEYFCAYEEELRGLPGVEFNLTGEGDEVWLRVAHLMPSPPPAPHGALHGQLVLPNDPNKIPWLNESASDGGSDGAPTQTSPLNIRESALQDYLDGPWSEWMRVERARRRSMALYTRLFALHQAVASNGADVPVELVWGIGIALWNHDSGKRIAHPLIAQTVELSLDTRTFALEVRPRGRAPLLEASPYQALGTGNTAELEAAWDRYLAAADQAVSPFDSASFAPFLRSAVSNLDSRGVYWPDVNSDQSDRALPEFGRRLTITDLWVLYARPRSTSVIVEDLERLARNLHNGAEVPPGPATLVIEPADDPRLQQLPLFRGLGVVDRQIAVDDDADSESHRRPAVFFPKPYNAEQIAVVRRLENAAGVVVQGPPGTGKTHTIANLICHYLANGKKILVSAKSESALAVLRDHVPVAIRPLVVALLTDEKAGMRQFELAIETIAANVARLDPNDADNAIELIQSRVAALQARLTTVDRDLAAIARHHRKRVRFFGRDMLPEELARHVIDHAPRHEWLVDRILPGVNQPQFLASDIDAARSARRTLGAELLEQHGTTAWLDLVPDSATIERIHDDLVRMAALSASLAERKVPAFVDRSEATFERAELLRDKFDEAIALADKINAAALPYFNALWTSLQTHGPVALSALNGLRAELELLAGDQQCFVERPVDVHVNAELESDFIEALERAASGKKATGLLSLIGGTLRQRLHRVRVAGLPAESAADWAHVLALTRLRRRIRALAARWSATGQQWAMPAIPEAPTDALAAMLAQSAHIDCIRDLALDRPAQRRAATIAVYGSSIDYAAANLDITGLQILRTNHADRMAQSRLAVCGDQLHPIRTIANERSTPMAKALRQFLSDELGSPRLTARQVQTRWEALVGQLTRFDRHRGAYRDLERVAQLVEASGAPIWAHALRTEPAIGSADDRWTPGVALESWEHRQATSLLATIDGREALRRLQIERAELEQDLARAYESMVEQKCWREIQRNATPALLAALQAYLNAVRNIGRGSGNRAARYRREARAAMAEAYHIVPCWVMPHWRVSETLPAEIGAFDLVVVDEASQSDLGALPTLLRGTKLLVVGDDKQVAPEGVELSEERITVLRERFLADQPFGDQMTPEKSLFDLARVAFASNAIMLREHFRCVTPIIEFAKREFYRDELRPLRVARTSERLDPPLVDIMIRGAKRKGSCNDAEARIIVAELKTMLADPRLAGRSIGVVSLFGMEQAQRIAQYVRDTIPAETIVQRQLTVGDARAFQGKERDIMLLSMVATTADAMTATGPALEQAFNVATSRARDRMILVRSVELASLSRTDLKARLIEHFAQPFVGRLQAALAGRDRCVTVFERALFDFLHERGFRVYGKVEVGNGAIDLVVEGDDDRRFAIECDGDQSQNADQWVAEIARQRVLERAGWPFWRAFAASFYTDRDRVTADLLAQLSRQGIVGGSATRAVATIGYCEHRVVDAPNA